MMAAGHQKFRCPLSFFAGLLLGFFICYHTDFALRKYRMKTTPVLLSVSETQVTNKGKIDLTVQMAKRVRIVCMIFTVPSNHHLKAWTVKQTWARRCNAHFFVSEKNDRTLSSFAGCHNGSQFVSWNKTKFAFQYALARYGNKYDYFLKADDETYVIVENLRRMLMGKNPNIPTLITGVSHLYTNQSQSNSGECYVLSRAALMQMNTGLKQNKYCQVEKNIPFMERIFIHRCQRATGVKRLTSRDQRGRERFHPLPPSKMVRKRVFTKAVWDSKNKHRVIYTGLKRCSDSSVSFHGTSPLEMRILDYFLYQLRPFGVS